jgi:hypothetical protein
VEDREEFQDYQRDKWWWFVTYLELAATICAQPQLSAKNTGFDVLMSDYKKAAEEFEKQKKRSVLFGSTDD